MWVCEGRQVAAVHTDQPEVGTQPEVSFIVSSIVHGTELSGRIEVVAQDIVPDHLVDPAVETQPYVPARVGCNSEYCIVLQHIPCMKVVHEPALLVNNIQPIYDGADEIVSIEKNAVVHFYVPDFSGEGYFPGSEFFPVIDIEAIPGCTQQEALFFVGEDHLDLIVHERFHSRQWNEPVTCEPVQALVDHIDVQLIIYFLEQDH